MTGKNWRALAKYEPGEEVMLVEDPNKCAWGQEAVKCLVEKSFKKKFCEEHLEPVYRLLHETVEDGEQMIVTMLACERGLFRIH